ncbi:MAG: chorismate-binding protein, partial [Myxococcota bacterium]
MSASPELFLSYDPSTRTLRTRPMKGTRPASADPQELEDAEKDRAELAMIVDLMRNDLTRVCRVPSTLRLLPQSPLLFPQSSLRLRQLRPQPPQLAFLGRTAATLGPVVVGHTIRFCHRIPRRQTKRETSKAVDSTIGESSESLATLLRRPQLAAAVRPPRWMRSAVVRE